MNVGNIEMWGCRDLEGLGIGKGVEREVKEGVGVRFV